VEALRWPLLCPTCPFFRVSLWLASGGPRHEWLHVAMVIFFLELRMPPLALKSQRHVAEGEAAVLWLPSWPQRTWKNVFVACVDAFLDQFKSKMGR
jgi:hypothetical protein